MSFYRGMTCENVTLKGDKGTPITAYVAKPSGPGPFPGVVLIHHLPGWSEFYIETTRRFAHHGYLAICANLYERAGEGNPDDVAAKVRADGGIPDAQMVGDTEAAVKWMRGQPNHNGKVGLFGSCSGGRHAFIYACQKKDVDACAELVGAARFCEQPNDMQRQEVRLVDDLVKPKRVGLVIARPFDELAHLGDHGA